MEELTIVHSPNGTPASVVVQEARNRSGFIGANTTPSSLEELRRKHIIPVFTKDNEPLISHSDFISAVSSAALDVYGRAMKSPEIRVSHPVKGRIPEAKDKPALALQEHEKTLYYERMAFMVELDGIHQRVDGSLLKLSVGGVKSYGEDNFSNTKGAEQRFHMFIGFKNTVCTNLCVWSDGSVRHVKVRNVEELYYQAREMVACYDAVAHISDMERFTRYELTERQFAQLVGRARMYAYLPQRVKRDIPPLLLSDSQINRVTSMYYADPNFRRRDDGSIDLWRLFNCFTGANKSSYIDTFLERGVNAHQVASQIADSLDGRQGFWFLN